MLHHWSEHTLHSKDRKLNVSFDLIADRCIKFNTINSDEWSAESKRST